MLLNHGGCIRAKRRVAYFFMRIRLASVKVAPGKKLSLPIANGAGVGALPLQKYHALAPPLEGSHTGETMNDLTITEMDAMDQYWKSKLIGVASDGATDMMERL